MKKILLLDNQFQVISFCNNGDLMMWDILDLPKNSEKVEHEKKCIVTVQKHNTKELYDDFVWFESRELFIATNLKKTLVVYDELCKKLALSYIDPNI